MMVLGCIEGKRIKDIAAELKEQEDVIIVDRRIHPMTNDRLNGPCFGGVAPKARETDRIIQPIATD
jgi:hypothetical protein